MTVVARSQLNRYLRESDFADNTRRAVLADLAAFARWFCFRNSEPLRFERVTVQDVGDFRCHLRNERRLAVATVNRSLVSIRRLLSWLCGRGDLNDNPASRVRELRRQPLAPQGLDASDARRLLREAELRADVRAYAILSLFLHTGCRIGDAELLEVGDLVLGERSGHAVFRRGKGAKERTVPLPVHTRKALSAYLDERPPVESARLFIGERGPLTAQGIRRIVEKYGRLVGADVHPHRLRHTFACQFLRDNANDLVGLAQILGHESLNTTARYTRRSHRELAEGSERLRY